MTFRQRVAAAASAVVAVAVVLACAGAYHISRDSLVGEVDTSLQDAYFHMTSQYGGSISPFAGIGYELVLADGSTAVNDVVPVDGTIKAVANGNGATTYETVTFANGSAYRLLIEPLPATEEIREGPGPCPENCTVLGQTSALVLYEPVQALEAHLHALFVDLLWLGVFGVLVAALFGWFAARASLIPLERTTKDIEDVADTLDVGRRINEGRNDELGRLRRACNRLLSALQDAQDAQRQLILDSSHELRTPLTSLRMNAQVLQRVDELTGDDALQLSNDMMTQVDELATLVGDLVELARGTHSVEEDETFDLDEVVAECVQLAETHARPRQVTIEFDGAPSLVRAKRSRVQRAVGNLLDNAIKFSPPGGTVQVRCLSGSVSVEDSGPGIDEADRPHVFDRFYRSPRDRGMPGSGLGLAIVAQVAAEAGGSVEAMRSATVGGARLVLRLPLAGTDAAR